MSGWTIYHNPDCGTSRKVLAALCEAGHEPAVVEYKKTGWTRFQLEDLFAAMGVNPRDVLRTRGTQAEELGLVGGSDEAILTAMTEHPILVERPIVVGPNGAKLCRPAEKLQELL
jgi:arsenate reductase (glutaredoxin)